MIELQSEVDDLLVLNQSIILVSPNVELVRSISYQKIDDLNRISIVWNIKESIYKIANTKELDYKTHSLVIPFNLCDNFTYSWLIYKKLKERYASYFLKIENYSFAYLIHTNDE